MTLPLFLPGYSPKGIPTKRLLLSVFHTERLILCITALIHVFIWIFFSLSLSGLLTPKAQLNAAVLERVFAFIPVAVHLGGLWYLYKQHRDKNAEIHMWEDPAGVLLTRDKLSYLNHVVGYTQNPAMIFQESFQLFREDLESELNQISDASRKLIAILALARGSKENPLHRELLEVQNSNRNLAEELVRAKNGEIVVRKELEHVKHWKTRNSSELKQVECRCKDLKANKSRLQREEDELKKKITAQLAEIESIEMELTTNKQRVVQKDVELWEARKKNRKVKEDRRRARKKLEVTEAERKEVERNLVEKVKEKGEIRRKVKDQKETVEVLQTEVEEVMRGREEAVEKYRSLCFEAKKLREEGMNLTCSVKGSQTDAYIYPHVCRLCMKKDKGGPIMPIS